MLPLKNKETSKQRINRAVSDYVADWARREVPTASEKDAIEAGQNFTGLLT